MNSNQKYPGAKGMLFFGLTVGVISPIIGLLFVINGWFQANQLQANGIKATATVTLCDKTISKGGSVSYVIYYSFSAVSPTNQTQTYHNGVSVNENTYQRMHIGKLIDVIYLPSDPQVSQILGDNTSQELPILGGLMIGGIGIIFSLIVIFEYYRKRALSGS